MLQVIINRHNKWELRKGYKNSCSNVDTYSGDVCSKQSL